MKDTTAHPRAVVHQQILEEAEKRPKASIEAIAADIVGATEDLVERVLRKYGDPAREQPPEIQPSLTGDREQSEISAMNTIEHTMDETADAPNTSLPEELTERQIETLRKIAAQPTATQRELAEELGVSAATVCSRLADIEGFEWENRAEFVETHLAGEDHPEKGDKPPEKEWAASNEKQREADLNADTSGDTEHRASEASSANSDTEVLTQADGNGASSQNESHGRDGNEISDSRTQSLDEIQARLDQIETTLDHVQESVADSQTPQSPDTTVIPSLEDPDLLQKVIHSVVENENISAEEEQQVFQLLVSTTRMQPSESATNG